MIFIFKEYISFQMYFESVFKRWIYLHEESWGKNNKKYCKEKQIEYVKSTVKMLFRGQRCDRNVLEYLSADFIKRPLRSRTILKIKARTFSRSEIILLFLNKGKCCGQHICSFMNIYLIYFRENHFSSAVKYWIFLFQLQGSQRHIS